MVFQNHHFSGSYMLDFRGLLMIYVVEHKQYRIDFGSRYLSIEEISTSKASWDLGMHPRSQPFQLAPIAPSRINGTIHGEFFNQSQLNASNPRKKKPFTIALRIHVWYIHLIWLIFMGNVGKYTIHGSLGLVHPTIVSNTFGWWTLPTGL